MLFEHFDTDGGGTIDGQEFLSEVRAHVRSLPMSIKYSCPQLHTPSSSFALELQREIVNYDIDGP